MADVTAPQKKTYFFSKEEKSKIQQSLTTMGFLTQLRDGMQLKLEKEILAALKRMDVGLPNENVNRTVEYDFDKGEVYIIDTPKPSVEAPKDEKATAKN